MSGLKASLGVEVLEARTVPAMFGFGGFHLPFGGMGGFGGLGSIGGLGSAAQDPTVQADLTQLQTDTQKLHTDQASLHATLQADLKGVIDAIQNAFANNTDVQAAQTTLQNDISDWMATLRADLQSGNHDQFQTDLIAAGAAIHADAKALQDAINADAGVAAAKAQLTTDQAPITADKAAIQADLKQLAADVQAAQSGTGGTGGTGGDSSGGTGGDGGDGGTGGNGGLFTTHAIHVG